MPVSDPRPGPRIAEGLPLLGATLGAVLLFPALLSLRSHDDNTLVSWRWVYEGRGLFGLYALHLAGVALAFALARRTAPRRAGAPLLFATAFLAAAGTWGTPEAIVDAGRYFTQAKHLAREGAGSFFRAWGRDLQAWTDLPGIPFLDGLLFRAFGEGRRVIQVFTALLLALTAVVTAGVGRMLWDRETGTTAGWLLLASPFCSSSRRSCSSTSPRCAASCWRRRRGPGAGTGRAGRALLAVWRGRPPCLRSTPSGRCSRSPWVRRPPPPSRGRPGRRPPSRRGRRSGGRGRGALLPPRGRPRARAARPSGGYQRGGLQRWGESHVSTFLFQVHPLSGPWRSRVSGWGSGAGREDRDRGRGSGAAHCAGRPPIALPPSGVSADLPARRLRSSADRGERVRRFATAARWPSPSSRRSRSTSLSCERRAQPISRQRGSS